MQPPLPMAGSCSNRWRIKRPTALPANIWGSGPGTAVRSQLRRRAWRCSCRMPELPEVETTVRGLRPFLEAHTLKSVETRRGDLRRPFPVDLRQRLTGARVTGLNRRAKYGLIDTDRGDTLVFHLGMSGHWRIDPSEILKHDHFLMETDEGRRVALNDARRFGSLDLVRTEELPEWPPFKALGPEPLDIDAAERQ